MDLSKLLSREAKGKLDDPWWDYASDIHRWEEEISGSGCFDNLTVGHFPWQRTLTAGQYVGVFQTYSDFFSLPKETRTRLSSAMTEFIERSGGKVCIVHDCVLFQCRCVV